jgi:hypothetical protein
VGYRPSACRPRGNRPGFLPRGDLLPGEAALEQQERGVLANLGRAAQSSAADDSQRAMITDQASEQRAPALRAPGASPLHGDSDATRGRRTVAQALCRPALQWWYKDAKRATTVVRRPARAAWLPRLAERPA